MRYNFDTSKSVKTGRLIDDLVLLRNDRLRRERVVDEIKEDERLLGKVVEERLNAAGVSSMRGKRGVFTLKEMRVPHVVDWGKFYQFMREEDAIDLLQKRVAVGAFKEYVDDLVDGVERRVPGVRVDKITKSSLTAVK